MCVIFGFLDYGKKVSANTLKRLFRALSVAAESSGTDAIGIGYVSNDKIMTFKKVKAAHKVKLYFPKETTALIGHTGFTTQGSEKQNYNNHPFEGKTTSHNFALAHNPPSIFIYSSFRPCVFLCPSASFARNLSQV